MDITDYSSFGCDECSDATEGAPFGGYSESVRRRSYNPPNRLYYHQPLWGWGEGHKTVHETDRAILFEVGEGQFWVPRTLIRKGLHGKLYVHRSFERNYIQSNERNNHE